MLVTISSAASRSRYAGPSASPTQPAREHTNSATCCPAARVEAHLVEAGQVDHDPDLVVEDERREAVAAGDRRQPPAGVDRLLHRADDLAGAGRQPDVVGPADPALV